MPITNNQNLILIEGAATYERILTEVREVELDEGIRHIQDFLKIYPDFAPAHNDLAVLYYQSGNSLKTLAHYEKAHKLDPGNVTYRKNLADFYFVELEWAGEAIHTYLDILKDNPFDIETLNSLGTISVQLGRKEQARQYFSRTLQIDDGNREAHEALQQLPPPRQDARQLPQGAYPAPPRPSVEKPAVQSPTPVEQPKPVRTCEELYREATACTASGKTDEAIQVLETVVAQYADQATAHNDLGVLYQRRGEIEKSRRHHEEAVRIQPGNTVFQKNLADLLCKEFGAVEEALTIYVNLFSENRHDIEIMKAIAYICIELGRSDDALFFLNQILTIKPWDQEAGEAISALKPSNSQDTAQ